MIPGKREGGGGNGREGGAGPVRTQVVGASEPRSGGAVSADGAYS